MNKPELLSPAGGVDAFKAAILGGADAIYVGGELFNARAYAKNLDLETLKECVELAHANHVRVYVTLNTLILDKELETALHYAEQLRAIGVDALICCDVGLISLLSRQREPFPIDASTQCSFHSSFGVKECADLPFRQIVLARELSKDNILACKEKIGIPMEIFLHGALCVCHSGQCLFSSIVGGRSGNRGECAQPCRLPYNGGYPLSLKDLSLAKQIPELLSIGVSSLKIEGRMKSPEYVYRVTKIYRKLIDENRNATPKEYQELEQIFSRSGFTDGYFTGIDEQMLGVRSEQDKQESKQLTSNTTYEIQKVVLKGKLEVQRNKKIHLIFETEQGIKVESFGEIPNEAQNAPLTKEVLLQRMSKLGNTPFTLDQTNFEIVLDEGLNVAPGILNALRRETIKQLTKTEKPEQTLEIPKRTAFFNGVKRTALFYQTSQYEALREEIRKTIQIAFVPLWELDSIKTANGIWLPPVILDNEEQSTRMLLQKAKDKNIQYALCSNPGSVYLAKEYGFEVYGDFRLNIFNGYSAEYWKNHGVQDAILSPELTTPQMRDIGGRAIVYGRIPLMLTERCYAQPNGCSNCNNSSLTDRKNVSFPIVRIPNHRNYILNSIPTYMGDRKMDLPKTIREHFLFFKESKKEIEEILNCYDRGQPLPYIVRRFPKA